MEVAEISRHWQKPLAVVDVGLKTVRFIHHHPTLVAGGAALLTALRAGRIGKWLHLGWMSYKKYSG